MSESNSTRALKLIVKKQITAQHIKLENGIEYVMRFECPIFKAKDEVKRRAPRNPDADPAPRQEPPMLVRVTDFTNGEPVKGEIIVPAVLETELKDAYPDDTYVGKTFLLVKHRPDGKRYNTFEVSEVEIDTTEYDEETGEIAETEEPAKPAKAGAKKRAA